ncbi:MAG: hypothetical protein RIQ79_2388 [Verrucomicrobiota bacterium]|jgi:Tfp pilus assembly protein PilV
MIISHQRPPVTASGKASLRRQRNRGFTVLEVTMAAFVLIFGICSAILTLKSGINAIDTARDTTLASQILQSEMERIRLLPWDTTSTYSYVDPVTGRTEQKLKPAIVRIPASEALDLTTIFPASVLTSTMTKSFTATRTIADVTGKSGEMKEISIVVTWISFDGTRHTRKSTTQYAKGGLYDYYYTSK